MLQNGLFQPKMDVSVSRIVEHFWLFREHLKVLLAGQLQNHSPLEFRRGFFYKKILLILKRLNRKMSDPYSLRDNVAQVLHAHCNIFTLNKCIPFVSTSFTQVCVFNVDKCELMCRLKLLCAICKDKNNNAMILKYLGLFQTLYL